MKKNVFLAVALFALMTVSAFAQQWATDLPTNVSVVFQTTRVPSTSRDGFFAPNGVNPVNGTTIHLWDMNGNETARPHRLFQLVHLGEGWYQIKNKIHGVLDLPNNLNESNIQMQLYEQNNSFNGQQQRFRFARVGDGLYQIYTSHGRNLHVWNSQTVNGTPVVTWTGSHTDANQNAIWRIYTIDNQNRLALWTEGQPQQATPPAASAAAATTVQGNNLADKVEWLKVFAQSNTSYIVEVRANESIDRLSLNYGDKNGITITVRGVGANRTINGNVEVGSGVTLILDNNITLALRTVALDIKSGGWLIMNNGTAITGDGITVANNAGVYMKGGTLSGGYRVEIRGGTFVMEGGAISGKTSGGSNVGGAVLVTRGGTFSMSGGTISGNKTIGVYVESGTFTMSGGIISGNTALEGGGVYVERESGTFTMNGGTISGNTARDVGGGVYVKSGTFTMNDGTISGNTARFGGGVYGSLTMTGGTISGNTARENGGGVFTGTFTKTGGIITGYSSDQRNGNVVKNESGAVQNYKGHAVYANAKNVLKIREGTAGPGDNMSYNGRTNPPTADGAWDN